MRFSIIAALFCGTSIMAMAASSSASSSSSSWVLQTNDNAQSQPVSVPIEATDLVQPPEIRDAQADQPTLDNEVPEIPIIKVFPDKTDDEVVQLVTDHLEKIDTLQAKFYQQAPSGALSQGQLSLRRPGLLRFEYEPPSPLLIIANGGTVFVTDKELKTTDSYPVRATPLKFLLRKKIDFDKAKIIQVDRGSDAIAVTIAANDEETQGELTLVLSAPEIGLIRWVVRDARNGLTIIDLDNVVLDEKLNNGLFRIPETKSPFLKD